MFNTLASKIFGRKESKKTAKNRLEMVLVQDRSGLNAKEMDSFREELLAVITKFFVLGAKDVEIEWQRTENSTALIVNTPVSSRARVKKNKAA